MNAKNSWFEQTNLRAVLLFSVACSFIYLDNFNQKYFKNTKAVINDAVAHSSHIITWPIKEVLNVPGYVMHIVTLNKENEQIRILQEETQKLITDNKFLRQNNQKTQRFIQEEKIYQNETIPAKVILRVNTITASSMTINKGAGDGLKIGNPVVKNNNLIGQVEEVNYKSSRVKLLSDINSNIPVLVGDLLTQAIFSGDPSSKGKFNIQFLPKNFRLKSGDSIYTSEIDGFLKKGILVGTVSDAKYDESTKKQTYSINFNYSPYQTDYVSVFIN
jgi:rod shape-determining protein MreC